MDWLSFIRSVEEESPGDVVVEAAVQWFTEKLKASKPSLAEGFTEASVESLLPFDIVLQACCRRILRAVESVSKAKRLQVAQLPTAAAGGIANVSAGGLANLLAPAKTADVANLLDGASLQGVSFSLQAKQGLWSAMRAHSDEARGKQDTVPVHGRHSCSLSADVADTRPDSWQIPFA